MTDTRQQDTQKADGELQGAHTAGHNRTHTAATEHTTDSRSGGQAEGRQGGGTDGSRQGARRDGKKKEYVIYLRERGEKKHRRDSQKYTSVCIYILLNIVAWWPCIALSFIYIRGILYISIYIYYPD